MKAFDRYELFREGQKVDVEFVGGTLLLGVDEFMSRIEIAMLKNGFEKMWFSDGNRFFKRGSCAVKVDARISYWVSSETQEEVKEISELLYSAGFVTCDRTLTKEDQYSLCDLSATNFNDQSLY